MSKPSRNAKKNFETFNGIHNLHLPLKDLRIWEFCWLRAETITDQEDCVRGPGVVSAGVWQREVPAPPVHHLVRVPHYRRHSANGGHHRHEGVDSGGQVSVEKYYRTTRKSRWPTCCQLLTDSPELSNKFTSPLWFSSVAYIWTLVWSPHSPSCPLCRHRQCVSWWCSSEGCCRSPRQWRPCCRGTRHPAWCVARRALLYLLTFLSSR